MGLGKSANKCRGKGLRAQWWDYSHPGDYFITICTKDRRPWFGAIIDQQFMPSESGIIAREMWEKIPQEFRNIELGAYVIMPDHIHGILSISKQLFQDNDKKHMNYYPPEQENVISPKQIHDFEFNDNEQDGKKTSTIPNNNVLEGLDNAPSGKRSGAMDNAPSGKRSGATRFIASNRDSSNQNGGFAHQKSPMLNNNISRVIRWYKGACTFQIRKSNPNFQWQSRFYDRMIRNPQAYHDIAEYIRNNPMKWGLNHPTIGK